MVGLLAHLKCRLLRIENFAAEPLARRPVLGLAVVRLIVLALTLFTVFLRFRFVLLKSRGHRGRPGTNHLIVRVVFVRLIQDKPLTVDKAALRRGTGLVANLGMAFYALLGT